MKKISLFRILKETRGEWLKQVKTLIVVDILEGLRLYLKRNISYPKPIERKKTSVLVDIHRIAPRLVDPNSAASMVNVASGKTEPLFLVGHLFKKMELEPY